jgi:hypothetical protein
VARMSILLGRSEFSLNGEDLLKGHRPIRHIVRIHVPAVICLKIWLYLLTRHLQEKGIIRK